MAASNKVLFFCLTLGVVKHSWLTHATEVIIASDNGPPHMIAEHNAGIDLDIVSEVLRLLGHTPHYVYAPLHRAKQLVIEGKADLFVPTFYQQDSDGLFSLSQLLTINQQYFLEKRPTNIKPLKRSC